MTDNDLEISRLLKAPRAKVWRAWADPKNLAQWWCPKPWVTEVRAFEFRAGGAFHTFMTGPLPDGTPGTSDNPGCFLDVTPMERIVSTSVLGGGYRPIVAWLPMTAIITMADEAGGTRYVARVLHLNEEDRKRHNEMGFSEGWGTAIDQLDAVAINL